MEYKERILNEIEKIKNNCMFTITMQEGYNSAIDKFLMFFEKENDKDKCLEYLDNMLDAVLLTQFMQAGYNQAIQRMQIIVAGETAEDFKKVSKRQQRCRDCAYLVSDQHGNWTCNNKKDKNVITISENECNL